MGKITIAATQMACTQDVDSNISNAERLVVQAVEKGAQIVLLQELFESLYFCQEEKPKHFSTEYSTLAIPANVSRRIYCLFR